jgi:hypothetical protein
MTIKTTLILCFTLLLGLYSCDNKPQPNEDIVLPPPLKGSVMIVNEGGFQNGNGSLTILDVGQNKLYNNMFEKANGRKLGDVFQSINTFNGKSYLVVNNSQKIEVINPVTFKSIATITGFTSPRYIIQIDANKAYVSEYYANAIKIVDLSSNTIAGSIPMQGLLDEMVLLNDKVYVTNATGNYVYVINASTNTLVDSVKTIYSSVSLQVDSAKNIWVLCNGNGTTSVNPALLHINTQVDTVDKKFSLTMSETSVSRLRINNKQNTLYWLCKHVYKFGIYDDHITTAPFIQSLGQNFYGLGVNPNNNEIYVSDAKDFVRMSSVYRYSQYGFQLGEFKAGIITGDFYFYYP